jgi:hypothetical protein
MQSYRQLWRGCPFEANHPSAPWCQTLFRVASVVAGGGLLAGALNGGWGNPADPGDILGFVALGIAAFCRARLVAPSAFLPREVAVSAILSLAYAIPLVIVGCGTLLWATTRTGVGKEFLELSHLWGHTTVLGPYRSSALILSSALTIYGLAVGWVFYKRIRLFNESSDDGPCEPREEVT